MLHNNLMKHLLRVGESWWADAQKILTLARKNRTSLLCHDSCDRDGAKFTRHTVEGKNTLLYSNNRKELFRSALIRIAYKRIIYNMKSENNDDHVTKKTGIILSPTGKVPLLYIRLLVAAIGLVDQLRPVSDLGQSVSQLGGPGRLEAISVSGDGDL